MNQGSSDNVSTTFTHTPTCFGWSGKGVYGLNNCIRRFGEEHQVVIGHHGFHVVTLTVVTGLHNAAVVR